KAGLSPEKHGPDRGRGGRAFALTRPPEPQRLRRSGGPLRRPTPRQMRNLATSGGVLLLCLLAFDARADQVEYSFSAAEPPSLAVTGGPQPYTGYRLSPGGQVSVKVKGPGVL